MLLEAQWEGNDDAQATQNSPRRRCEYRRRYRGPQRIHSLLAPGREPPLGAHVVALRRGYTHHGIYVGAGKVVHYAGLARGLHRGPVEEVSVAGFAAGQPLGLAADAPPTFDSWEVVRRARSRVGEDCYRLLTNNCEHFCEWCLRGQPRSYQVEACFLFPVRMLEVILGSMADFLAPSGRAGARPARAVTNTP